MQTIFFIRCSMCPFWFSKSEGILTGEMETPGHSGISYAAIDVSGICNLRCIMCSLDAHFPEKILMDNATFSRILGSLPLLHAVSFGCNSEPLANKDIFEMVGMAKAAFEGKISIVTNGMLLSESASRRLLEAGIDDVWVSLDGVAADCFDEIRLGGDFSKVIENVRAMGKLRDREGRGRPDLGIIFTLMRENLSDLKGMAGLCSELGVTKITVNGMEPYSKEMASSVLYGDLKGMDVEEMFKELEIEAAKRNISISLPSLEFSDTPCSFLVPVISPAGNVSPCPALSYSRPYFMMGQELRYERVVFGNILNTSLETIWASDDYTAFRNQALKSEGYLCRMCLVRRGVICPVSGRAG